MKRQNIPLFEKLFVIFVIIKSSPLPPDFQIIHLFNMKLNRLLISLSLILFSGGLSAQSPTLLWSNFHTGLGDNSERFNKVVPDGAGNYVAVGYTVKQGNYRDLLTVKFNSSGDTLWWQTKNGKNSFDDEAVTAAVDAAGNIYVAGWGDGGITQNDIILLKYNSAGVRQWDTTWNGTRSLDDIPVDIAVDGSGNIIITGNTEPDTVSGSSDYITVKFNPNGGVVWQSQFSRSAVANGKDEVAKLGVDGTGDVFVTGRSSNGSDDDYVTLKYSGIDGTVLWTQIYNSGNGTDRATGLVVDHTGSVIVSGRSDNGNNDDIRTIKYNSSGTLQWTKGWNSAYNQNDRAIAITVDGSDNVFVCGQTDADNSSVTDYDFSTLKYNASGVLQWSRIAGSTSLQYDIPASIITDTNGNVIITGKSDLNPDPLINDYDIMTVMYNTSGTQLWMNTYAGTRTNGGDIAYSVVTDNTNIYVVGGSDYITTQKDATVIKYDNSGATVFVKHYNGLGDFSESARSLVIDNNDHAYAGGYTYQEDHNRDIFLVAVDNAGNTLCSFTYNGSKSDDDELTAVAQDASGNVYATGYTKSTNQKSDFFTMKWNPNTCDTVWTRIYNFSANQSDKSESMVVDAAGNVYITGRSDSDLNDTIDNNDIVTIKYNTNGNQIWLQRYNGIGNLRDEPSKIILDNSGNVIVCGRMEKLNDDDFVILKYDPITGNPVWASPATYNGPFSNDDRPLDMVVDNNNDIFVAGYSQTGSGTATDDAVIVEFDAAGNQVNFFGYDGLGLGNDVAQVIAHDNQDNIIVSLKSDVDPDPLHSNYNYLTIKFDHNLSQLWANPPEYNSPINGDDVPTAIYTNAVGDVFVTGTSETDTSGGRTNHNWVTVRYNDQGIQTFVADYDGPANGDDSPNAIALRGTSMWLCGYVEAPGIDQKDLAVLRYDISVGLPADISTSGLSFVYPNPFSNSALLVNNLFDNSHSWNLNVTDVLGREVKVINGISSNSVELQKEEFANGIYHYQIISGSKILDSGKFIIQ